MDALDTYTSAIVVLCGALLLVAIGFGEKRLV
jgi:hypothetical protein